MNKLITLSLPILCACISLTAQAIPLKPQPEVSAPPAVEDEAKFLNQAYEESYNLASFVHRNDLLSQLCTEHSSDSVYVENFQGWLAEQQSNLQAVQAVKQAYEQRLLDYYGPDFQETFDKRLRLTLKGVTNSVEKIAQRTDEQINQACENWLTSVQDKQSFFYTKLGIGLIFFADNQQRLLDMIADDKNW